MIDFLQHQWLKFKRSPSFGRELGVTILIAVMGIFVTLGIVVFALVLPRMINDLDVATNPIQVINKAVVYYFMLEFVLRYLIQRIPVLDIEPYLTLPVRRRKISLFLLLRSFLSVFNVYPLIILIPLASRVVAPLYGTAGAIVWAASIAMISWSLHFLLIMFKNKYQDKLWVWVIILGIVVLNFASEYWFGLDMLEPLSSFFTLVPSYIVLSLIPLLILLSAVVSAYRFLIRNLYAEEIRSSRKKESDIYSSKLAFLNRKGLQEAFMLQEIKMIFRHKRTRSVIVLSLLFIPYGLLFFGREQYADSPGVYILIGIFMSGLFTINYGQFFWSWNTNQLDFYFTRPIQLKTWVQSRYRLLILSALISTSLCLPYLYFGWEIMLTLLCCCLFNIGINIPLMMRISMWKPKAIDLSRSSFMNYQGTGLAQWIMAVPIMVLPYLVYLPFRAAFGFLAGIAAIGLTGLMGFLFREFIIDQLVSHLKKMKYLLIRDLTI